MTGMREQEVMHCWWDVNLTAGTVTSASQAGVRMDPEGLSANVRFRFPRSW